MIQVTMASDMLVRPTLVPNRIPPLNSQEEANHRIANHLQLISALIAVEARGVSAPETLAVLKRMEQRIAAIGGVHRQLCTSTASEVDLGDYLEILGEQSMGSCGSHRRIVVDADTLPVASQTASAIGILVSELVTNSCKHAYAPDEPGSIVITLRRRADGSYRLMVEDCGTGVGMPEAGSGIGSRLIKDTVVRLGALAKWEDAQPGTRFVMDFHL
jgi:two-component sensor histidine kinase